MDKNLYKENRLVLILNGLDCIMCGTYRDKSDYLLYKSGQLNEITEEQKLEMNVLSLLEKLGYPMEELGTYFYKNMIVKVIEYLKKIETTDNLENYHNLIIQLKDSYSQFYVDVARNDLDVGIKPFHAFIAKAISKVDYSKTDPTLLYQIYSNFNNDMDYGEQAFVLGAFVLGKIEPKRPDVPMIKKLKNNSNIELKRNI